ncbi:DUF86 domain-containing protein [Promicromonospora sp. NPDC050880]|uniref:DUF86 domain-containing protein n=1 Tax=Promicromonospora sp. NPDC050880 TaxID=3364406 RepID=UPI003790C488
MGTGQRYRGAGILQPRPVGVLRRSGLDVGWPAFRGMRNVIAHVYDGVDDELVWRALEKRVPQMIEQLVDRDG